MNFKKGDKVRRKCGDEIWRGIVTAVTQKEFPEDIVFVRVKYVGHKTQWEHQETLEKEKS